MVDASIVIAARASDGPGLAACLAGIRAQHHDPARLEVLVVQYGGGARLVLPESSPGSTRLLAVDHTSPYAARNRGVAESTGELLLFTEPGYVPEPGWVGAHVARLRAPGVTISIGHVAPARATRLVELFTAYEDDRDAWVFSGPSWRHYFGRPPNMAVTRGRFASHGPFAEVARGADSILVQRVARGVSCDEVGLTPDAVTSARSIRGLPSCLRDRFDHSRQMRRYRSSHAAPITREDRVRILRRTLRRRGGGPLEAGVLPALLAAGLLAFRAGGWVGARQGAPPDANSPHAGTLRADGPPG